MRILLIRLAVVVGALLICQLPYPSRKLLKKLKYNDKKDQLMHVGDLVAKGTIGGSLGVLSKFSAANISGNTPHPWLILRLLIASFIQAYAEIMTS